MIINPVFVRDTWLLQLAAARPKSENARPRNRSVRWIWGEGEEVGERVQVQGGGLKWRCKDGGGGVGENIIKG